MDAKKLGSDELKKIGEVAKHFGTTPRTLLFYEEEGILSPAKTTRGTRLYSEADMRRFEMAHRLASVGVPLRVVKQIATTREGAKSGDESGRKLCALLDTLGSDLKRDIHALTAMQRDVELARLIIRQCWDCPNRPTRGTCPDCPCEKYKDEAPLLWLTWDVSPTQ